MSNETEWPARVSACRASRKSAHEFCAAKGLLRDDPVLVGESAEARRPPESPDQADASCACRAQGARRNAESRADQCLNQWLASTGRVVLMKAVRCAAGCSETTGGLATRSRPGEDRAGVAWPHFLRTSLVAAGVTVMTFLGVLAEDMFVDLIGDVLKPFTASLVTLFPIGAFFSLMFQARAFTIVRIAPAALVLIGPFIGVLAAMMAAGIYLLMGQPHATALVGWWVLVGLGCAFTCGVSPSALLSPFGGCIIALTLLVWAAASPLETSSRYATGSGKSVMLLSGLAADSAMAAPDLPAAFWAQAEKQMGRRQVEPHSGSGCAEWRAHQVGRMRPTFGGRCDDGARGLSRAPRALLPRASWRRARRFCAFVDRA